jgi:hypothetical protein
MVSVRMIWEVYDRAARRLVAYGKIRDAAALLMIRNKCSQSIPGNNQDFY